MMVVDYGLLMMVNLMGVLMVHDGCNDHDGLMIGLCALIPGLLQVLC